MVIRVCATRESADVFAKVAPVTVSDNITSIVLVILYCAQQLVNDSNPFYSMTAGYRWILTTKIKFCASDQGKNYKKGLKHCIIDVGLRL